MRRFRRLLFVSCAALVETNLLDCTDTVIIGHLLGDAALGALGLFWPCLELISFVATMLAGGIAILFTESVANFNERKAERVFSSGFHAIVGIGLVLTALMYFGRDLAFSFLGAGPETLFHLRPYWTVFAANALLLPISIYLATMVCADGDGPICTLAFATELVVNGVASYVFCLKWGAAGCALGTVAGTLGSLAMLPLHFRNRANTLVLRLRFSLRDVWDAVRLDFSESSCGLFLAIMYAVMNKVLVMRFGDGALTVMAAVIMANAFTYFLYGVAKAAQPIVGVYYGEGNAPAVRDVMRDAVRWSLALGGSVSAVFAVFPEAAVRLAGVSDPDLFVRSAAAVRTVACSYVAVGLSALFVSYFLFIERMRVSLLLAALQGAVCPVIGCLVGVLVGGERAFWTGYALATPVALAIVAAALVLRREGRNLPFLLPHDRDARIWFWQSAALSDAEACRIAQGVRRTLGENGADPRQVVRGAMMVEDTLVQVKEANPGRTVDAEVTLDMNDGVRITFRDGGRLTEIGPESVHETNGTTPDAVRRKVLASLGRSFAGSRALVTTGFNRNAVKL